MQRLVRLLVVLLVAVAATANAATVERPSAAASSEDTCWATGDLNSNTVPGEVADYVFLARFIGGLGPPPNPIYEGDLNADGWVDYGDVEMLWSIIQGKLVVEWPLATVCDPDTIRGACWLGDSCSIRSPENCAAMGGFYLGDGSFCDGPCYADGDMNGDGYPLSVADLVMLIRFVERGGPPPNPFFKGDLNADCFVDFGDLAIFDSFFTYGLVIFPQFPVPTCCYPDTVRGACFEGEDCHVRSSANCSTAGGTYSGDGTFCTCDCTGHCDLNLDGRINPIDVVRIVFYVYRGVDLREQNLACPKENGDWNCDDQVNPEDVIAYINYAYRAWDVPPCDPCEP